MDDDGEGVSEAATIVESTAVHAAAGSAISGAISGAPSAGNDDVGSDGGRGAARGETVADDDDGSRGCGEQRGGDTGNVGRVDRSVRMTEYPTRTGVDADDAWLLWL